MKTIESTEFESPLAMLNAIRAGSIELPVEVRCGRSLFTIRKETFDVISLAVLMAALWEEEE